MTRFALTAAAAGAVLLAGCTMDARPGSSALSAEDRAELAEATAGRTAGPPVQCVQLRTLRGNRGVGNGLILFERPGNRIYINRPRNSGCSGMRPHHSLAMRTSGLTLCSGEPVRVVDPTTGINYGSCALGDFTPYDR